MELAALAVLLTFFGGYFFRDAANKVAGASESSPPFIVPIAGRTAPGPWVDAIRSLGNAEARATHYGKARLALELALPYSEEDPTELNNLAWYYLLPDKQAGTNPQRALQLINQALGVRRAWEFLDTAAEAHFQLGDFKEAIRLETEAINAPNERRSANDSAFLERQMEKFQNAEQTHIHVPVAPVQK
jgi:tetratricopeptide (TPR) repeat protein